MGIAVRICIMATLEVVAKAGQYACTVDHSESYQLARALPIVDEDNLPVPTTCWDTFGHLDQETPVEATDYSKYYRRGAYRSSHSREHRKGESFSCHQWRNWGKRSKRKGNKARIRAWYEEQRRIDREEDARLEKEIKKAEFAVHRNFIGERAMDRRLPGHSWITS